MLTAAEREILQVEALRRGLMRTPAERAAARETERWRLGPRVEPESPAPSPFMTQREVAAIMHVTRQTVYNWVRYKRVRSARTPTGGVLVERASLEALNAPQRRTRDEMAAPPHGADRPCRTGLRGRARGVGVRQDVLTSARRS